MDTNQPQKRSEDLNERKVNGLAALGLAIGAAKRGNHCFVMLSYKAALDIHALTKIVHKRNYQKAYQKRYRKFKASRLKAKIK
jgi:hypothetical protein